MTGRGFLLAVLGAIVGAIVAGAIAYAAAGEDIGKLGDFKHGALRFIGFVAAIGAFVGFFLVGRLVQRGPTLARDGFTFSYRPLEPTADGYREIKTITVGDLLAALHEVGYEPRAEACNELGERAGTIDHNTPLVAANVAISDPRVQGWIRVQLPPPAEGQQRALGLVEIWSSRGESAEELGLFALRTLDRFVGNLTAARETSQLSQDPVALLVAPLGERPKYRR